LKDYLYFLQDLNDRLNNNIMKKLAIVYLVLIFNQLLVSAQNNQEVPYKLVNKIPLEGEGFWDYLTVESSSARLFVSHSTMVQVVDLKTNKLAGTISGTNGVHGVALAPAHNKGFVSDGRDNSVTVFNLKTLKVTGKIKVTGSNPDAILYDPYSQRVLTFNGRSSNSTVIDAITEKVIGTIPLSGKPEFAVTNGKGKIWVNIEDKSQIAQINPVTLKVEREWSILPGEEPSGLAIDIDNDRLFSVCRNKLMVISDAKAGKVIASLPIGGFTDGAAFDPVKKLAFASNGIGTLTVVKEIDKNDFVVLGTLNTQLGARTIALDNVSHHLYLPVASHEAQSSSDNSQRRYRQPIKPGSFVVLDIAPQ
jgi:YVTN family beta-propeller protein